jgi:hypothetical protein
MVDNSVDVLLQYLQAIVVLYVKSGNADEMITPGCTW